MKRTLVRNRRLYLESGSAIRCTTAPRRAASKVRRVRIRGSARGRAPCRQATRAGVGSTSAVESVLISSPWRDVVAPLAGDRSLRGLAAMKRLRTDQREALHARISLVQRLARFLAQDLQARVAASLIEVVRGFGVEDTRGHMLSLRITQDTIADLSAGSVRKVNAVLRRFERDGLVRKEHGRIVLPDVGALEALALGG